MLILLFKNFTQLCTYSVKYSICFFKMAAILFVAAFLCACNQTSEKKNKEAINSLLPDKKSKIEVTFIGEVRVRRSFAHIQFIKSQKEIDKYIARQEKNNPIVEGVFPAKNSFLISQFERLGVIKNGEFLPKKFKPHIAPEIEFIDALGRSVHVKFYHSQLTDRMHIKFFFQKDSLDINTEAGNLQDLNYKFLDVIPGGNKELVFLDSYHISNGDNFDLKVYQIVIQ